MAVELRNGNAAGVLRLGELVAETEPVEVGGRILQGFKRGKRCPRSVAAEFHSIWLRYQRITDSGANRDPVAYSEFVTGQLMVVLPGLQHSEADLLDEDEAMAILRALEWLPKDDAEAAEGTNPPATSPTGSG